MTILVDEETIEAADELAEEAKANLVEKFIRGGFSRRKAEEIVDAFEAVIDEEEIEPT